MAVPSQLPLLLEALKTLKEPATGLGLVASHFVELAETDQGVDVRLFLPSPGYPHGAALEASIRQAVTDAGLAPSPTLRFSSTLRVPHKPSRQDLDRLPSVKNVLAIAAGKGGVGKSTFSVNIAMALRHLGASVGLLDADIYGPSLPKMLGVADEEVHTAQDRGDGRKGIAPARYRGMPVMSVAYFVEPQNAVVWRGPMIHKLLTQFVEEVVWGPLDYLVVDLPPGTGDAQLSLAQLIPITGGLLVTTPQEVALLDVRKAANMFTKVEIPVLGVAENMSYYRCPACGHHDEVFGAGGGERLAQELGVSFLGQIPLDPRVAFGGESGHPIVETDPEGALAKVFLEVAAAIALEAAKRSLSGPRRSASLRTV